MLHHVSLSARENRLLRLNASGEYMDELKGLQRTKESSIGAAGNIVGGTGQILTGSGKGRLDGALRLGQGALDIFDVPVSGVADGIRSLSGMPTGNEAPSRFNVTRAFNDYANIRTDDPMNTVKDGMAWTAGMVHAVFFKGGSDLLKAARGMNT